MGFESWLERDRAMLLDHDRRVVGLASQPFRLTWQGAKRRISHRPDYFARLEDGSGLVVDARPADRVGPEDAVKFSATEAMCQETGCWSYALVHEPDPVEMANVRRLSGYRHPHNRVSDVADRLMDAFDDPRLLMDGAEAVGDPLSVLPEDRSYLAAFPEIVALTHLILDPPTTPSTPESSTWRRPPS